MAVTFYQSLPSIAFSSVYSGRLFIGLDARWRDDNGDIIGRTGSSNVVICARVRDINSMTLAESGMVDKLNLSTRIILNYPGGGVVWNITTVLLSNTSTATGAVFQGLTPIILTAELRKR